MKTFEIHHELVMDEQNRNGNSIGDGRVTLEEFIEYYNNISCSIDNDAYFDLMISNAWQLNGSTNPAAMPYAGVSKKVAHVNARDEYRRDHHRNLFGTDQNTVWTKTNKVGDQWHSTTKDALKGAIEVAEPDKAAGSTSYYGQVNYNVNQFGSTRETGAGYEGIKHSDDELVQKLRAKLASRGARGMIGIQRIFKILDDNGSGTLEIQEFWKGLCDFRLKFSQEECRQLFEIFDENQSGDIDIDEFINSIRGPMSPFRKELVRKAYKKLDFNGNGLVEAEDIHNMYNAKNHPDVKTGRKTEQEIIQEFLETFEAHRELSKGDKASKKGDGIVTLNEFMDYYSSVSASIDNDEYFQLMMTNAWNLDNKGYKKGVAIEI